MLLRGKLFTELNIYKPKQFNSGDYWQDIWLWLKGKFAWEYHGSFGYWNLLKQNRGHQSWSQEAVKLIVTRVESPNSRIQHCHLTSVAFLAKLNFLTSETRFTR